MISKKDALTLGVLAIGGVAMASAVAGAGGDAGPLEGKKGRAGGILGSQAGNDKTPTVYQLPPAGAVTFPKAPTFDIGKFLAPHTEPISRGAAGVSAAPKKATVIPVTPYLYTGGEIKEGAVSLAPWATAPLPPQPYAYVSGEEIRPGAVSVAPWAMVETVVKKDDPSTWRTRKQFMSTSPSSVRGYPGMSKKEAGSLTATKERLGKK